MKSKLSSLIKNFKNSHYEQIQRPFIIAEAGVNHECNIDLAKKLIEDAANSGANAIKFQTYKADNNDSIKKFTIILGYIKRKN